MSQIINLIGHRFGNLTVLSKDEPYTKPSGQKVTMWKCVCDCGNIISVRSSYLRNGSTTSCGCVEEQHRNITGQRFGRLIVIKEDTNKPDSLICKCDCGQTISVNRSNLTLGKTRSCGCLQKESRYAKIDDLTGQRFGMLTVIKRVENQGKSVRYLCRCDCGNEKIFYSSNLKRGLSTSCGCFRKEKSKERQFIDLTGQTFNKLTVLNFDHQNKKTKQYYWKCICECGNICIVYGGHLKNGHTTSCGCYNKERIIETKFIDLSGQKFGKLTVIEKTGVKYFPSGTSDSIWLCKCECGNYKHILGASLRNGTSSCGCIVSMGEELISSILKDNNISFKQQYSFPDLKSNKNWKLYFDFGILENDELKCLIEYQGRQHFNYDENWKQTKEDFEDGQKRDKLKREYCKNNNIPLIEIPYWDFLKINWDYIKDKIDISLNEGE